MSAITFSVNDSKLRAKFGRLRQRVTPKAFQPELMEFARNTLNTALKTTPVRNFSIIKSNQTKQYEHRINYIPSYHEESDPCLIVSGGVHWLKYGGRWFKANEWRLPDDVFGVYQVLLGERERRMQTLLGLFIANRAQARFLYQRSWLQIAQSIGIMLAVSNQIRGSRSRHEPPKPPTRGHAQIRGGKHTLSIVFFNPFLEQRSEYKPFSGKAIISSAANIHRPSYISAVDSKLRSICADAN